MKTLRVVGPTHEAVFYAREGDHITHALEYGYYETDLLEEIRIRQIEGEYIDVGAHIGNHTVFFGLECPANRVLAIEPHPETYVNLCTNVLANGLKDRVICINAAVHSEWMTVHVIPAPNGNSGMSGIGPEGSIATIRLDDLAGGRFGLIKIDTEGSSLDVLRTASKILQRDHPLIAAEAIDDDEFRAVSQFLADFGYERVDGPYAYTPVYLFS